MKKAALSISVIALILSVLWFYFDRGFEPLITALLGLAGIVGSLSSLYGKGQLNNVSREFDAIKARWLAERELGQPNLDDARWILSEVLDFLQYLRVEPNTDSHHSEIDKLILAVKKTQNMDIYIDGGVTYNQFWEGGTTSIEKVHEIARKI